MAKSEENSLLGAFRSRIDAVPHLRLSKLESRHQHGSENSLLIQVLGSESQQGPRQLIDELRICLRRLKGIRDGICSRVVLSRCPSDTSWDRR
jgi:hypothetical protein